MMISRRDMLAGAAGGAAAMAFTGLAPALAAPARFKTIGLQLYTVREIFQKDPVGTLEQIARIGYREVEYGGGGYEAMDHALLRKTTDRLGLKAPSLHIGYEALLSDFDRSVTMAKALGADTLVAPHMAEEYYGEARWQEALLNFNRLAKQLKTAGLGFAYHNHEFEFVVKPGGKSLYDQLLEATDPALVKLELDLYWVTHAGENPAALIDRLGERLYAFHVKDIRADRSMAAVGQGTIDFAGLFKRKASAGVRHFYVENDQAPAPYIPDITTSFQALRQLRL
jgi:sugar phosphate isomerase/epimerase